VIEHDALDLDLVFPPCRPRCRTCTTLRRQLADLTDRPGAAGEIDQAQVRLDEHEHRHHG
jgi:hypothetical protein